MFAIGIRYLCGRAVATHPADRERPEWPPHPDRVFMALAAAHFETDGEVAERHALEWLETEKPPALAASEAKPRSSVTTYVPVNDVGMPSIKAGKEPSDDQAKGGLALLPTSRPRQPRQFPAAIPDDPVVHFIWPDSDPSERHRQLLAELCRKVTYVGHSSSLVQAWVENKPPKATWVPADGLGSHRLRITGAGRLADLEAIYQSGRRPASPLWFGYGRPRPEPPAPTEPHTVFEEELIVFRRVADMQIGLETTLQLTAALRGAVMALCPEPLPEWVSGHAAGNARSEAPHLTFIPLPHVGREHADGRLMGVAIAVPRLLPAGEVAQCLQNILNHDEENPLELKMGRAGVWHVAPEDREAPPLSLRGETWTGPSEHWATVTPVVFDRHPKGKDPKQQWTEAEEVVRQACSRIFPEGPDRPTVVDVTLSPVSMFVGAPHARRFPYLQRKSDGGNLHHTHAIITFDRPVRGPVLIGAGRYRGYGLCRPYKEGTDE